VSTSAVKVLGIGCLPLLEAIQTIQNFTASFIFFWFYFFVVYMVVCFVFFYLIVYIMYSYCYVYVFLMLSMFRSRYCVALCTVCV